MRAARLALRALATLLAVVLVAFFVVELAPGDAATTQLGARGSEATRAALREALGLHGSVGARLGAFVAHAARGDLGRSLSDGRPVLDKIAERLPATLALALVALAVAWSAAIALALVRAPRRRRAIELGLATLYAVPVPALALALLAAGAPYGARLGAITAAALCLAPLLVPSVHAHVARALDESLGDDGLRALRAAGATHARLMRAALRGQALRLLTLVALQLPALLSGAALVETVFGVPGLGLLAFDALAERDHPVQLGLVIVGAATAIGATLIVELVAPLVDPRLRDGASR